MKAKKRPLKTLSARGKQRAKYVRTVIEPTRRLAELLAEKTAAALTRGKGRDLYDVWFLLSAGITLDRKLLARKGGKLDVGRLPGKAAYERDLSRLTPTLVPYGQVIGDIRRMCGDGQYNGERRR